MWNEQPRYNLGRGPKKPETDEDRRRAWRILTRTDEDGLHWLQGVTLGTETAAALQLVAHGRRILLSRRPIDEELESLFAVLSLGVERLLKVTLGHAHLRSRPGWPRHLGEKKRHRIADMNRQLLSNVERGIDTGTYPEKVQAELQRVRQDCVLIAVLEALESFATGGRFQRLDILAGVTSPREGALDGWTRVLEVIDDVDPPTAELGDDDSEWLRQANAVAERAIGGWLGAIETFAKCDTLGLRGRQLAAVIHRVEDTVREREEIR